MIRRCFFVPTPFKTFLNFTHLCISTYFYTCVCVCVSECVPLQRIGKNYTQFGKNFRHCVLTSAPIADDVATKQNETEERLK